MKPRCCFCSFKALLCVSDWLCVFRCAACWRAWSRNTRGRRTGAEELTNWDPTVRPTMWPPWSVSTWNRRRRSSRYDTSCENETKSSLWSHFCSDVVCFCQACTLARRNADVFLKYMHRNSVNMPGMLSHVKAPEQQVKSKCWIIYWIYWGCIHTAGFDAQFQNFLSFVWFFCFVFFGLVVHNIK